MIPGRLPLAVGRVSGAVGEAQGVAHRILVEPAGQVKANRSVGVFVGRAMPIARTARRMGKCAKVRPCAGEGFTSARGKEWKRTCPLICS